LRVSIFLAVCDLSMLKHDSVLICEIGLLPTNDHTYALYFNQTILGEFHEKTMRIKDLKPVH
jgi:hypothetical protein